MGGSRSLLCRLRTTEEFLTLVLKGINWAMVKEAWVFSFDPFSNKDRKFFRVIGTEFSWQSGGKLPVN